MIALSSNPDHPRPDPSAGRGSKRLSALALCLLALGLEGLLGAPLAAAEEEPAAPSFFIEEIRIEGARQVSEGILLAESRLEPGTTYDEDALRKAIYRLLRLPFVLDASFALRRGSERGRYLLEVTIEETRRFFYQGELVARESNLDSRTEVGRVGVVGWRQFLSRAGVAFAALDTDGLQAGYHHYDLLGKKIFLGLSYSRNGCCLGTIFPLEPEPEETLLPLELEDLEAILSGDRELGQALVGFPLRHSQSLFLSASREEDEDGLLRKDSLSLSWLRDTSDDPFFPTRGVRILAQVETADYDFRLPSPTGDVEQLRKTSSVSVSSTQHWPIGYGHAISMIIQGGVGHTDLEDELGSFDTGFLSAGAGVRFSMDLLRGDSRAAWSDMRWESTLHYRLVTDFSSRSLGFFGESRRTARLTTSIALRHDWGILRLGFVYSWIDNGRGAG